MRIDEIGGEFGLIDRLRETHGGALGTGLTLGMGDDAAVIAVAQGDEVVVTTDMLVEGIHFRREWSDPYSIGWKAAAVNLSDIAAMGGTPTFSFISIALGPNEPVESIDRLYDGFNDCLHRYGVRLAGGDTNTTGGDMVISVTQLGVVTAGKALTRSSARIGDSLLVTGTLGDAAAGLALLTDLGLARAEKVDKSLLGSHRRPQPRIVAGRAAARIGRVRAAMDISDGLYGDLGKLCAASHVGARIEVDTLPVSSALRAAAPLMHRDARQIALIGGEDYELLLAVAPADVTDVTNAITSSGTPVAVIGEIVKSGLSFVDADGAAFEPETTGWDHFKPQ